MPMLEGIGEKTGAQPEMITALRLAHIESAKIEYKKEKAKKAHDNNQLTEQEYNKEITKLDQKLKTIPKFGQYVFK